MGYCIMGCGGDEDCPPAMGCNDSGRCAILVCEAGTCPVSLFGCGESGERCARVDCSSDPDACPVETSCVDGVCIEDRF